jgi:DNA-binding NarL/FixJ family response regulator
MTTAHPRRQATILVGQTSSLVERLVHLFDNTEFQVIARATGVDHLRLEDLQKHETVLLIFDANDGVESAIRQLDLFRTLHANSRIAVVTRNEQMTDLGLLFRAGAHAYFVENTNPAIFLKTLRLVMLGNPTSRRPQ